MGFIFGLLKKLLKLGVYFLIFATLIVVIPNLPPYTSFTKITLEPGQPRTGPLAPNGALDNAEKLYIDKVLGPEAYQMYKGEIYTSLATGEIVKLTPGGHVTFVTKIGQPCTGIKQEHICGRPLGFVFDEKKDQMYVADAYHGIWKIDLKTDKKQLLVSPNVEIKGRTPRLFNFVALDSLGNLYWTDSTSDFQLKDGAMSMFSDPSGRVFQYNAATNSSIILMDNLWFPNGVAVSPDNTFLVVAETFAKRLHKYYINGPKKGKSEVFVSGLPGTPDNVRALPDGSGVLVGLPIVNDENSPDLIHSLAGAPYARKFIARIQRLVEIPFEFLNQYYPHYVFEDIVYKIGHFNSLSDLVSHPSGLLQIDWNGNIVASYFNSDGSIEFVSDGIVVGDKLYLGRPHSQNFIGAVPAPPLLKKAFSGKSASSAKVEASKPTPQPPKPTHPPTTPPLPKTTTTPPKTTTTPPKTTTSPPKTTTSPPKTTTSPPKTTTTPPKTTTPPPKTTAPPPKTTAPPPKTTTPPAQQTKPTAEPPKSQERKDVPKQTQELPKVQPAPAQKTKSADTAKTAPKPNENQAPKPIPTLKSGSDASAQKATKEKVKQSQQNIPKSDEKSPPQQIPIKEDIPSDTIKPNKETLRVIKREGPTEIPNPNL
ncbi:unnamed protein product [Chilo suppressalis]|uniref:Strictosidine synthase conserved region domain-containing protein n=1 Tax=Chilo suppressalis TaxID=168631 RepID=A0ABN8B4D8_CHISP|nr:unnamed protein product [Chilo suppressalis]